LATETSGGWRDRRWSKSTEPARDVDRVSAGFGNADRRPSRLELTSQLIGNFDVHDPQTFRFAASFPCDLVDNSLHHNHLAQVVR
jgi:hypothetical protein